MPTFPHQYLLHSSIRSQSEGDPVKARQLALEAGLAPDIAEMIALSTNWRPNRDRFRELAGNIAKDEQVDLFWRGVANEHIAATSEGPLGRELEFEATLSLISEMPEGPDKGYIKACCFAGLHDTPGAKEPEFTLEDCVTWFVTHGAYNAPGRTEAIMRQLLADDRRDEATEFYRQLLERSSDSDAYFSPSQMARVRATAEANGISA